MPTSMFISLQVLRALLAVVCGVAFVFVTWRFILPLIAMHVAGVGVAIPLPKRFVKAYPKLAIWLFRCWEPTPPPCDGCRLHLLDASAFHAAIDATTVDISHYTHHHVIG